VSEWNINFKPFSELLSNVVDNRGKTCPTAPSGLALIATNCIKNDNLYPVYENVRYVSDETYKTWFRGHPLPGDLIFVTKGTPGRVCLVPSKVDFCIAQDMVAIRAANKKVNPKYLFAALRSAEVQSEIENLHVGSLIPHFKKGDFDKLQIPLPERELQEYIGEQYFTFSAKIDLLHRQNKTLEGMAEAVWRKMFVEEADPGWKKGKLGDIAAINPLRSIKKGAIATYLDMSNMPTNGPFPKACAQREFSSGMKFKNGDTIIARITPCLENGKTAYVNFLNHEEIAWGSTEYIVLAPKAGYCSEWYYFLAINDDFRDFAIQNMTGTSGRQRVSGDSIAQYEIVIPPVNIFERFRTFAGPVMEHIKHNSFQIRTLSRLRDTLLPKLMSGEVRVIP
jgi:type I restriction enzyme S subunit